MEKKFMYEVAKELLAREGQAIEHYFLDGDCPEIMAVSRVIEYATALQDMNSTDDEFPERLKLARVSFEIAVDIIEWFGESLYEIDMNEPPQSIKFIKEDK